MQVIRRGALLRGFGITIALVALSMVFVDRPLATWVHETFRSPAYYEWAGRFYDLLLLLLAALLAIPILSFIKAALGRDVNWRETSLAICWAGAAALVAAIGLKLLIGRSAPYPEWVIDHLYWFKPFHRDNGVDGGAMPSATATVSTAICAVLMERLPRYRPLCAVALAVICLSLPMVNAHWLSDVIAGIFVGMLVGRFTLARLDSPSTT